MIQIYLDLETTVNGGPEGTSPEAHWHTNKVLLCGWKYTYIDVHIDDTPEQLIEFIKEHIDEGVELVAHNAKFDIKYLMRDYPEVEWHKINVWDTMTWYYRYTGHNKKFPSLEDTCKYFGVAFTKGLDLGALLASGIKMEDIPKKELSTYLEEDVSAVFHLYRKQHNRPYRCEMNYILPLCEMELNGMKIDKDKIERLMIQLIEDTDQEREWMISYIKDTCEWKDGSAIVTEDFYAALGIKSKLIKPMSNRTLSFLLTGQPETLQITPKWILKTKIPAYTVYTNSEVGSIYGVHSTSNPLGFSMNDEHLEKFNAIRTQTIIKNIQAYRKNNKLLSTYVSPFSHTSKVQGTIHPKLNTTSTNTGRLSSSGPNGQNIPPTARQLIVPRNEGDEIIEIDFSQIEMVAVACITKDKNMIDDLNNGVDIHYVTGKKVYKWANPSEMTKATRKLIKNVNFGVLYGGGAAGLSKQTGIDKKTVQQLINSFYDSYPSLRTWQRATYAEVCDSMSPDGHINGEQVYTSTYLEPKSNRRFRFKEQKSPSWLKAKTGRGYSFSPQQISNYPIQGFAGGDLVLQTLYYFWLEIKRRTSTPIKFIMTVHDSIVLEGPPLCDITVAMNKACRNTKDTFNLPVQLSYNIERGTTWQ